MLKRSYRDAGVEAHMASLLRHPTSADQPHSFPNVVTEPSDVRGWQVKSWIWNGDLNGRSLEALQRREGMGESRGKLTTWRFCTLEVVTHHSINQCLWLSYGSENQLFFESLVFFLYQCAYSMYFPAKHACILADLLLDVGEREAAVLEKVGCSEKYQAFLHSYQYLDYSICHIAIIFCNLSPKA